MCRSDDDPPYSLQGATVLVTGGTGTFGSVLVDRMLASDVNPKKIIVYSRCEHKQADMRCRLGSKYGDLATSKLRYILGDIRQVDTMRRAMNGVDVVFHTAAYKRIESGQYCPHEVVDTNIMGTVCVINAAVEAGVNRLLFISSDKACQPTNLYGKTKAVGEDLTIASNVYGTTRMSCTRWGNVWGSRGSVVEKWRAKQDVEPIRIYHQGMTRFFITLDHAVKTALSAIGMMLGGEIIVPIIKSCYIEDVAHALCPDSPIEYWYMRAGEKIHETLISAEEMRRTEGVRDLLVIHPSFELPSGRSPLYDASPAEDYTSSNNDFFTLDALRNMT